MTSKRESTKITGPDPINARAAIERGRNAARDIVTDLERELGVVPAFRATLHAVELLGALDAMAQTWQRRAGI